MVVTDAHLFPPSDMKVRITCWDGRDLVLDVTRDWMVDRLKVAALEQFFKPGDSMKTSVYHRLIHVRLSKRLFEEKTLGHAGVKDNDEILLVKRRIQPFETGDKRKEERKVPDAATIKRITAGLTKASCSPKDEVPVNSVDFQTELRRILISLIEASQRILCLNPSAAKIFRQAEEMLSEPVQPAKIDESALRQLMDMGFPEARAKKALILNRMSVTAAMEWLFQNETDPDVDTPLPENEQSTLQSPAQENAVEDGGGRAGTSTETDGGVPHFTSILETIRAFKKREFRAHPRALQQLTEMGFTGAESLEALRMFRNDQDAACDWLLSERREQVSLVEEGLEPQSQVYQMIMDNPTVQLGLNNPRCLLAFLQMLENPLAANQWLNDPETGPILMQVSRIYQMRLDGERVSSLSSAVSDSGMLAASSTLTFVDDASLLSSMTSSVPPAPTSLPPSAQPSDPGHARSSSASDRPTTSGMR